MNIPNENELTLVCPVSFRRVESGKRRLKTEPDELLPESASIPRIAKLMALALRFDWLVRERLVENYADLARLGGVSFARISQILNLLNLAPDIQEELLFLRRTPDCREPVTEFQIRSLVSEIDWSVQRREWVKIQYLFASQ